MNKALLQLFIIYSNLKKRAWDESKQEQNYYPDLTLQERA